MFPVAATADAIRVRADIDAQDDAGMTPLMFAAFHGHDVFVLRLLERGASPVRRNWAGAVRVLNDP